MEDGEQDILIGGMRYRKGKELRSTSNIETYVGINLQTRKQVAIKIVELSLLIGK